MVKHIICVGAVYIDTILEVPIYPIEDHKLRATGHTRRRGGNCANTLEVLSQLLFSSSNGSNPANPEAMSSSFQIHLLAVLPSVQSDAVKFIQKSLSNVKLDTTCVFRQEYSEAAASYILQNTQNNSRTIISHNALPEMTLQEFEERAFQLTQTEDARQGWYHFEGRIPNVTQGSVDFLRLTESHQGFKISVELEKPEREYMTLVARHADAVFYSKLWAETNNFESPETFLRAQLASTKPDALLFCTWGARGVGAIRKMLSGQVEYVEVPAWPQAIGNVIDTIGAGDTFIAGMLYGLSCHEYDWTLKQKVEYANELAGRKVTQRGFGGLVDKMRLSASSLN